MAVTQFAPETLSYFAFMRHEVFGVYAALFFKRFDCFEEFAHRNIHLFTLSERDQAFAIIRSESVLEAMYFMDSLIQQTSPDYDPDQTPA